MLSFKKKLTSLSIDTQIGRTVAASMLGTEGSKVLEVFKAMVAKQKDDEFAKESKKNFLKLSAKIRLMISEKQIVISDNDILVNYLYSLYREFIKLLDSSSDPLFTPEVDYLITTTTNFANDLIRIVTPFMTSKNIEKIRSLTDIVNGLYSPVLTSPEYRELKDQLQTFVNDLSLSLQLDDSLTHWDKNKRCGLISGVCDRLRVVPQDQFSGSQFCHIHHSIYIASEINSPSMTRWLGDDVRRAIFAEYLKEKKMDELITFVVDVEKCKQISRPDLKKQRLSVVYFQHLSPSSADTGHHLRKSSLRNSQLSDTLDVPKEQVDKEESDILLKLGSEFHEKFINSEIYKRWVQSVSLPEGIKRQMECELSEKKLTLENFKQNIGTMPNAQEIRERETGKKTEYNPSSVRIEISSPDFTKKETKPEEVKAEEPKPEEVKAEEPKPEEVKAEEPKPEEVKAEEPKPEEVKAEEPKPEEVKAEEPKPEEVKAEENKENPEENIDPVDKLTESELLNDSDDEKN